MVERTKKIEGFTVTTKPWGFLTLMERKRTFLRFITTFAPNIATLYDKFTSGALSSLEDISQEDLYSILGSIEDIFEKVTSTDMESLVKLFLENVTIDGKDLSDQEVMDEYLSGNSTLFYVIVKQVLEVNFGDFLSKTKSLLGSLDSSLQKATEGQSNEEL